MKKILILLFFFTTQGVSAENLLWGTDGNSYYQIESGEINRSILLANTKTFFVTKADLIPSGQSTSLTVRHYIFL